MKMWTGPALANLTSAILTGGCAQLLPLRREQLILPHSYHMAWRVQAGSSPCKRTCPALPQGSLQGTLRMGMETRPKNSGLASVVGHPPPHHP